MKVYKYAAGAVAVAMIAAAAGCTTPEGTPDRTSTGVLTGAGVGAASGAIIGSMKGKAGPGAIIGGALGAVTGGIIGNAMDQQQRERLMRESPQTVQRFEQGQPLPPADVKALSKAGVGDEVIISQIRASRTVYRLTTSEIIDLKQSGVSERVIDFMISTGGSYTPPPPPPPPRRY